MSTDDIGKLPSLGDLAEWSEDQHLSFLRFCGLFIVLTAKGTGYRVTTEQRQQAGVQAASDPYFKEFLERIQLADGETTDKQFYYRLMTMVRLVLKYLRYNPERITAAMRAIIEPNKHFNSCLAPRAEIVPVVATYQPANLQEAQSCAIEKVANLVYRLAESIKPEEIVQMSAKDRMLALARLQFVLDSKKYQPPRRGIFQQINIRTASVAELEAAVIAVGRGE